jgi:hypothetical protein
MQALRAASRGYLPDKSFLIVSALATALFLIGWRAGLAAASEEEVEASTPREKLQRRRDKQGNPFEFLSLLFSLVKRW